MGILEILTLIFLTLKLTHNIDWSWWMVFSPLWIGYGLALVLFVTIGSAVKRWIGK